MKNYAIVGIGSRSYLYAHALLGAFSDCARLAAICDINKVRLEYANRRYREVHGAAPVPAFAPADFERMIAGQGVDTVIVTSIDRTHHHYIMRALEAGCDVITEKPLTVDADKCRAILSALERTGKQLRVTFNYRYAPRNSKVKELLQQGAVGEIKSVHFEWFLDTTHGADYFRRWHRDKSNSGGLLVHKASHHFDLVNWWLDSAPELVFAFGGLVFYGRANAEARGVTAFYDRGTGHPNAGGDPFALDLQADEELKEMYLKAEAEDGYRRDESVFGHYISIEDDMAVLAKYRNGAVMSYHLTAYSPCEGFRIAFNGSEGRLEYEVSETSYVSGSVPVEQSSEGGHGGGDLRMLQDLLRPGAPDPLARAADHRAGAMAVLTGIAANRSLASGLPVRVDDLLAPLALRAG
jgi:predicted dehydrogenase